MILAGGAVVSGCVERAGQFVAAAAPPVPVPPTVSTVEHVAKQARLPAPLGVRPELYDRALAALDRHAARVPLHDRIAIADFTSPSHLPRFLFIDLGTGHVESMLVAHGSGSDPAHTGMLQRFSNNPGSNATSEGAFLATDYYVGQHGQSQRLIGLDPTNNMAYERAIVVHSAWYANPEQIARQGKLGRSQGCFAVGERELDTVFRRLGQGRMIFASKV